MVKPSISDYYPGLTMRQYTITTLVLLLLSLFPTALIAAQPSLFIGRDASGEQLWQTDGTTNGTQVFRYLTQTPNANADAQLLGIAGKWGLFVAFEANHQPALWRTDGTTGGTVKIKALGKLAGKNDSTYPSLVGYSKNQVQALAGQLLFWTQTRTTLYLNRSDGSPEGTLVLASFPVGGDLHKNTTTPTFYSIGDKALFWVEDQTHGLELWRSDGTRNGTRLVVDATREGKPRPQDYYSGAYAPPTLLANDAFYFISPDQRAYHYQQQVSHTLWRSDGDTATPLRHLGSLQPNNLLAVTPHAIVFLATHAQDKRPELWQWQAANGQLSRILHFATPRSNAQAAISYSPALWDNGILYLLLDTLDAKDTAELWRSDLTTQGTYRLLSLPNPNSEYKTPPRLHKSTAGVHVLSYDEARLAGVWHTNGTVAGTKVLRHIPSHLRSIRPHSYIDPNPSLALPGTPRRWLKVMDDPKAGKEVMVLGNQPPHRHLLRDINTGPASSDLSELTPVADGWYFRLNNQWQFTPGDPQAIRPVTGIPAGENLAYNAHPNTMSHDTLYFLTENKRRITLWQARHGKATRLKTFQYTQYGYVWLFPSTQGVYAAQYHTIYSNPIKATWQLSHWHADQQQWQHMLDNKTASQVDLRQVLETPDSLFLLMSPAPHTQPAAVFSTPNDTLWWRPTTDTPTTIRSNDWKILHDGFASTHYYSRDTLQATAQHVYFTQQAPDNPLAIQLLRYNPSNGQSQRVSGLPPTDNARFVATPHGLFILSKDKVDQLWYLPNQQPHPRLLRRFKASELVSVGETVQGRLYLNVSTDGETALWVSDGSPTGTRQLKAGVNTEY